jgi:hypothetical protein
MKRSGFLLLILLTAIIPQLFSQQLNNKAIDEKKHYEILVGMCNRDGFATCNFDSAYNAGYNAYKPDAELLTEISRNLADISITIVMGTWCGDSKDQVPRFYKILDLIKFNERDLTLICVDRSKRAPGLDISALKIERVPTFIIYQRDKEIGRIVETPETSLEKDLLHIITKD